MVEQLDLSDKDVAIIAELIDALILKLVPCWSPYGSTTSIPDGSSELQIDATSKEVSEHDFLPLVGLKGHETQESLNSELSTEFPLTITSDASTNKLLESSDYNIDFNTYDFVSDFMMLGDGLSKYDKFTKRLENPLLSSNGELQML